MAEELDQGRHAGGSVRLSVLIGGLVLCTAIIWLWALWTFAGSPTLLGTAVLAFSLGLRHAVDADHIAAIDAVTRRLTSAGRRPRATGLYFALGHSSVVVALSLAAWAAAGVAGSRMTILRDTGGMIGTGISAFILMAVAVTNGIVLIPVLRAMAAARSGRTIEPADNPAVVMGGGVMAKVLGRAFGLVRSEWHMYPLGMMFGLGFDTATEIGLLAISAAEATVRLPLSAAIIFPALFTAGMTLLDTIDGLLMAGACRWALAEPVRRLRYNFAITTLSIAVAASVGGIEILGLVGEKLELDGGFWRLVALLNANFGILGLAIVGLVAISWALSALLYRYGRPNRLDRTSTRSA